jgi:hypothetical protein
MRLPHVRARVVVFLAAGGLLLPGLAACSDDAPEASPAPSASASASESAPAAPELPAAAKGDGPKAAEAFVRHYVDLINHASTTLDPEPMLGASADNCTECSTVAELYSGIRQKGGNVRGGEWTIERLEVGRALFERQRANVLVSYPRQVVRYKARGAPKTFNPGRALFIFEYRATSGALEITKIIGPVE